MKEPLYQALSDCLDAIQSGADIETCLARYPHLAADLRPLLFTAAQANAAAISHIPEDVMRRARTRVLDAAAEMRERNVAPIFFALRLRWPKFQWSARLARLSVVTLIILSFMVTGGTGLVSASNGALPGDQLYPLKRRLEDLRLLLVFDPLTRQTLEDIFEKERMEEIGELFSRGRESKVDFYGYLTARTETGWIINQVMVHITPETRLEGTLILGTYVEVDGYTRPDGVIVAERIRVRQGPEVENQEEDKDKKEQEEHPSGVLPSATSYVAPTPRPGINSQPTPTPESARFKFEGIIQSMDGDTWRISGQTIHVTGAEIKGQPRIGILVTIKGQISNGIWNATEVKVRAAKDSTSSSRSSSGASSSSSNSSKDESDSGSSSSSKSSSSSSSSDDDNGGSSSSSSSKSDDDD